MNLTLSTPIAQGRAAEIYAWGESQVIKLYREWCPPSWVDHEARVARAVTQAHIPTPAAGEIVEIHGRRGLVYQRVVGISMLDDLNRRPWLLFKPGGALAELQAQIHRLSALRERGTCSARVSSWLWVYSTVSI